MNPRLIIEQFHGTSEGRGPALTCEKVVNDGSRGWGMRTSFRPNWEQIEAMLWEIRNKTKKSL